MSQRINANRFVLGLLLGLLLIASCKKDEEKERDQAEFCQAWGEAACSDETVSACQAEDADTCAHSQEDFCRSVVPADDFSDAHGDDCLDAISDAYEDANLSDDELVTVLRLGPPCDRLLTGPKDEGESCSTRRDCNASAGFDCVIKGEAVKGTCQIPEVVGGGRDCEAQQKVCAEGFYCNGENCIEGKDVDEDCTIDAECALNAYCGDDGSCQERLDIDSPCTSDSQCTSGVCYDFDGDMVCTDRIVLSRSEPICADLR